jgi:hypothetical protein
MEGQGATEALAGNGIARVTFQPEESFSRERIEVGTRAKTD